MPRTKPRPGPSVGFTGTRKGMTPEQYAAVKKLVERLRPRVVRHGSAVGADSDFHYHCLFAGLHIERYPASGVKPDQVATCGGAHVHHPPAPPLERNRTIVESSEVMVAAPSGPETPRGGTWFTIRLARDAGVPCLVVWPDGRVELREDAGWRTWVCRFCDGVNDGSASVCGRCSTDRPIRREPDSEPDKEQGRSV